jgi:hypothetical protein
MPDGKNLSVTGIFQRCIFGARECHKDPKTLSAIKKNTEATSNQVAFVIPAVASA